MQECSDTDDIPYEVPIPSSPTVMSSVNSNAPLSFVSAPTNNETRHLHPVSAVVLPSSSLEEQQGAVGGNKHSSQRLVASCYEYCTWKYLYTSKRKKSFQIQRGWLGFASGHAD